MKVFYKETVGSVSVGYGFEYNPTIFYKKESVGNTEVVKVVAFSEMPEYAQQAFKRV